MDDLRLPDFQAQWNPAALDALPSHIALLDASGVIVGANAAWRRFALENGIQAGSPAPGTGIGVDYLALCDAATGPSAEGAAAAAAGIRAVLAMRQPVFTLEYACHSPQRQRWYAMTVLPVDRNEGSVLVVHTDITERRLDEERRRDSELRLQLALDATGDGIWDWYPQTGQVYLSPGYYALTGYRPEDEPGSFDFFRRLLHPDDRPAVLAAVETSLRGEPAVFDMDFRMVTASGAIRWTRGRGRVVERDAAGAPLRMLGLITDVSAFKRIEHTLQESEARYRAVVEDQTETIARIAIDGTILFANEVYLRFFGMSAEDVIGRKWQPVAHPDDLPMIEKRVAELAADRPVVVIENRVFAGDGSVRWMQFVNRGFFDAAGRLREIQSVGRDVTERRELEDRQRHLLDENQRLGQELIRLQEKERAALAKELHDELSQQLVAIRAFAGAIVRRTANPQDKTQLDAQAIGSAASDIYAISHRLMEGLYPQALDSAGLVAAIGGLAARWAQTRPDVRIRVRAAEIGPCGAEARINLFRIVQECLVNAVQHGGAQRIVVGVGERQDSRGRRLRIVVRDDGVGMQLDAPRTGFGLVIIGERVRTLGGDLKLASKPGRGLCVTVDVPLPA